MKYLSVYLITIAALVSVAVPQVSAKSGKIYFPDENAGNDLPNNGNAGVRIGNQFWTTQKPGNPNGGGECVPTTMPPEPQNGCCGRQASDDENMTVNNNDPSGRTNRGPVQPPSRVLLPPLSLKDHNDPADDNDADVSFDTRISGGAETGFTQYPWTVHLEATFTLNNGTEATFGCGGALISAKYVLSAAHCVSHPGAVLKSLAIYLGEYDTRTFPQDCKITVNGRECVENIRIYAEKIVVHHEYESNYLSNDISLIRLNGTAPYTQYIRPICLPTIDIESPDFDNPQFAVAGWGRNGQQRTYIKQATVLNLVNRQVCERNHYPYLVQGHICAIGKNRADACKGDSGGPLMILYNERYYVSGLVSGGGDDNCGDNNVPTLYTNVYYYLNWIRSNLEK